jgi:hypothetical protein
MPKTMRKSIEKYLADGIGEFNQEDADRNVCAT